MSIAIRELGLTNAEVLAELARRFGDESDQTDERPDAGERAAVAFLTARNSFCFAAFDEDEPVGWLWGTTIPRPRGGSSGYVHEIDVAEHHRRRGIGTLLVEAALGLLARNGCDEMWLVTELDNEAAHGLYRSVGGSSGDSCVWEWPL